MEGLEDFDSIEPLAVYEKPADTITEVVQDEWTPLEINEEKWPFKSISDQKYSVDYRQTSLNTFQIRITEPRETIIQVLNYTSKLVSATL